MIPQVGHIKILNLKLWENKMKNIDTQTQLNEDVMKGLLGVSQPISITLAQVGDAINLPSKFVEVYGQGNKIKEGREYFIDNRLVRIMDNGEIETTHTRDEPFRKVCEYIIKLEKNLGVNLLIEA